NAIVALQRNLIWLSDRVEACPLFEYYKDIQQDQQPKLFKLVAGLKDIADSAEMCVAGPRPRLMPSPPSPGSASFSLPAFG
ncbi:hypothetical protein CYMTET_33306, partial [Cymbomonas tetramitiformis]